MNENKLREYAKLIVKIGANVQKGQRVRLQAEVDQIPLAKMVTEECYKAGARIGFIFKKCPAYYQDKLLLLHESDTPVLSYNKAKIPKPVRFQAHVLLF